MKGIIKTLAIALGGIAIYKTVPPVRNVVDKAFDSINAKVDNVRAKFRKEDKKAEEEVPAPEKG